MIRVILYLTVFAFFPFTLGENCDKQGILLYEDLACQVKTKDSSCPTSYDCKDLNVPNKCVVQGKIYKNGEQVPSNSTGLFSCETGCVCTSRNNNAEVHCAQQSCPGPKPSAGCYKRYNLEKCCPVDVACPPYDTTICVVNYLERVNGERFNTKDSCHVCVCKKGFNGKYEAPYCKRRGCDTQLKYQMEVQKFCAPVYIDGDGHDDKDIKCCPSVWTCPDGSEHIKTSGTKSDSTCKYGTKFLSVGDGFEKEIQYNSRPLKIECKCNIPPLLICYKK